MGAAEGEGPERGPQHDDSDAFHDAVELLLQVRGDVAHDLEETLGDAEGVGCNAVAPSRGAARAVAQAWVAGCRGCRRVGPGGNVEVALTWFGAVARSGERSLASPRRVMLSVKKTAITPSRRSRTLHTRTSDGIAGCTPRGCARAVASSW